MAVRCTAGRGGVRQELLRTPLHHPATERYTVPEIIAPRRPTTRRRPGRRHAATRAAATQPLAGERGQRSHQTAVGAAEQAFELQAFVFGEDGGVEGAELAAEAAEQARNLVHLAARDRLAGLLGAEALHRQAA